MTRVAAAEAFVPILAAEIADLVAAGATLVQVDEPSPAIRPDAPADFAGLLNAAVAPASDAPGVRLAAHLCFGNYLGRPAGEADLPPGARAARAVQRRRARARVREPRDDRARRLPELVDAGFDLAVGVIDVKSSYLETPDDVAERAELVLRAGVPAERLALVPDCGFSQTTRRATQAKVRALVAGRDLLLGRLTG